MIRQCAPFLALLFAWANDAQAAATPEFEVASIKPSAPPTGMGIRFEGTCRGWLLTMSADVPSVPVIFFRRHGLTLDSAREIAGFVGPLDNRFFFLHMPSCHHSWSRAHASQSLPGEHPNIVGAERSVHAA